MNIKKPISAFSIALSRFYNIHKKLPEKPYRSFGAQKPFKMSFESNKNEPSFKKNETVRLIWHRRDLRLHDNELYHGLHDENDNSIASISLYIFDNQYFEPQTSIAISPSSAAINEKEVKSVWCGPHAAQALIEAVTSLRNDIRAIGGELLVRVGDPLVIVPQIAQEIDATEIAYNEEPGSYENDLSLKIKQICIMKSMQYDYDCNEIEKPMKLISKIGYTLYHPDDLPFSPDEWNRLAHPKQKYKNNKKEKQTQTQTQKKKKRGNKNDIQDKIEHNHYDFYPNYNHLDIVDVSPNRFKGICKVMGDFRKAAKSAAVVRKPLDPPTHIIKPETFDSAQLSEKEGSIPTLEILMRPLLNAAKSNSIFGINEETIYFTIQCAIENRNRKENNFCQNYATEEKKQKLDYYYGEKSAKERLRSFIDEGHASVADRSKADVSNNDSSRLSIHFALGTLSPRAVYWKAHNYTTTRTDKDNSCQWLMSHLEMRDFFLYTTFASNKKMFQQNGIPLNKKQTNSIVWKSPYDGDVEHQELWKRWATGKTQLPMVDAAMLELMSTGYCSNRVRQNVASVLTKDLQIDWRAGAEWFQFLLEDHCVGANYGNWLYFSGVGPDPKQRHFRTVSQLKRYDKKGEYVKKWIPSLRNEELEPTFRPWDFNIQGFDSPIVDPATQYTWQDLKCLQDKNKLFSNESEH